MHIYGLGYPNSRNGCEPVVQSYLTNVNSLKARHHVDGALHADITPGILEAKTPPAQNETGQPTRIRCEIHAILIDQLSYCPIALGSICELDQQRSRAREH
jgi:hypothetical protein